MAEAAPVVVAKNLDFELAAAEAEETGPKKRLIRVVCRVKKHPGNAPSCIKQMTPEAVHIWSVGNPNISTARSKKRKHNTSAKDITSASNAYSFDRVYGSNTTQQQFYDGEVTNCINDLVDGNDTTLFAYGNTSSGKTYTIFGKPRSLGSSAEGILFRVVKDLFKRVGSEDFELKISAFEIYNEKVYDLLATDIKGRPELKWRTGKNRMVKIEGLQKSSAKTLTSAETLLTRTADNRTVAETSLNHRSSRSHCVFTIQLCKGGKNFSKFVVVDLAGSERAARTKATKHHLKEANNINQSLMTLNRCFRIMRENQDRSSAQKQHVPFRDSKLTAFFQHNLTNPRSGAIVMIVTINPDLAEHSETISVLENSSIAKDVTYQKPPAAERTRRGARYDHRGRKIKTKKELEAESKRIVDAATAVKAKSKKCKLAKSQNCEAPASAAKAPVFPNSAAKRADIAAAVEEAKKDWEAELRESIRDQVINEYRSTMQKVMQAQLMKAQLKTDEAIADVEELWRTRFEELKAEHALELQHLNDRDVDDKDTFHCEIDRITTQKLSLRAQLANLQEENDRLRRELADKSVPAVIDEEEETEEVAAKPQVLSATDNKPHPKPRKRFSVVSMPADAAAADENAPKVMPVSRKRYNLRKRS